MLRTMVVPASMLNGRKQRFFKCDSIGDQRFFDLGRWKWELPTLFHMPVAAPGSNLTSAKALDFGKTGMVKNSK